ncbi:MFS transporter [Nitratireductor sp. OM-1]|uniref:MFS transporter n=1 Tax=Nitratireductor sp. OM-1 TaxID=1756988 RepID=UPI000DE0915C|nr:MFS transporter [Nitratireductor sp. OM-1]
MLSPLGSIIALLLGTAFLLTGSGLHGLLLPLRGQMEGFPTASLGALGAAWAAGFVAGCFIAPRIVRRAGHVRAFGAFAASGAIIALLTGMWVDPTGWVILRIFTGFTMAGAFMVIESWLNEKSTNENRGTVFGVYMMLTYASLTAGQMTVAFGDVSNTLLFMTTGILFCMALIPTSVSKAVSPQPLAQVTLDLKGLFMNSPVAFVGCLLVGTANGAWGTMGAVYGGEIGISTLQIATMMSIAVLAGAALQLPAGRLSDRIDRRFVIAGLSFGASLVGFTIFLTAPRDGAYVIAMTAVYGAFAYTLYSIIVAHANDHASPEDFVKVASGLLFLYGGGTMLGPLVGGVLMESLRPESLFLITALSHFSLAGYALLRITRRAPVPVDEREAFNALPSERAVTPQAAVLDPRSDTEDVEDSEAEAAVK